MFWCVSWLTWSFSGNNNWDELILARSSWCMPTSKHKEALSTYFGRVSLQMTHLHFTNFLENWLCYSLKCLFQQKRKNHCILTVFSIIKASLCLNQGLGHVRRLEQENSSNVMNTTNSSNVGRELKLIGENTLMTS